MDLKVYQILANCSIKNSQLLCKTCKVTFSVFSHFVTNFTNMPNFLITLIKWTSNFISLLTQNTFWNVLKYCTVTIRTQRNHKAVTYLYVQHSWHGANVSFNTTDTGLTGHSNDINLDISHQCLHGCIETHVSDTVLEFFWRSQACDIHNGSSLLLQVHLNIGQCICTLQVWTEAWTDLQQE